MVNLRAVQDYDLYWICIDYFKRIQSQYAFNHILSDMITVEYDTITLWLQYNMTPIFNHNIIEPKPAPWHSIWDPQPNFRNPKYSLQTKVNIICTHIYLQSIAIFGIFWWIFRFNLSANLKYFITYACRPYCNTIGLWVLCVSQGMDHKTMVTDFSDCTLLACWR